MATPLFDFHEVHDINVCYPSCICESERGFPSAYLLLARKALDLTYTDRQKHALSKLLTKSQRNQRRRCGGDIREFNSSAR